MDDTPNRYKLYNIWRCSPPSGRITWRTTLAKVVESDPPPTRPGDLFSPTHWGTELVYSTLKSRREAVNLVCQRSGV